MNDGHKRNILFLILIIALTFTSCVTQKYQQPGMTAGGQLYRDTSVGNSSMQLNAADTLSFANLAYTDLFGDTVLQNLISEGLRENLDLKIAIERINEASANFYQSRMALLPSLDGKANVSLNKQSIASLNLPPDFIGAYPLTTTTYQASISTSWEADIWGKLKSTKKVAFANLLQSDAAKRAIQTQLVATIATYYYQLLSLDQQLKITEQTLETRIQEVETMKALKESAVITGAAVVQSEANRYAAEVTIPDLKQSIRETENELSI